jgi:large subunit ribosomal protein L9
MASNVQVILSRDVPNLGRIGEIVNVKPGYARNYLLPQRLAMPVSKGNLANLEHHRRMIDKRMGDLRTASEDTAKRIAEEQVTITARVGKNGKLFGSVGTRDIAGLFKGLGYKIDHRDIKLDGPFKEVGLYTLELRLEADVKSQIKVIIAGEEVEDEMDDVEELSTETAEELEAQNDDDAEVSSEDDAAAQTPSEVELATPEAVETANS